MKIQARFLGLQSYSLLWRDMRRFTDERDDRTVDEIWVVEHPPVFTRGQRQSDKNGESIVVPGMGPVPVVSSDRGGLITYHGPGQIIFYVLIDLKRAGVGIRRLVAALEQSIIDLLRSYGLAGARVQGAPGVYVEQAKIASLGLRVRRGCTYHGLSLNVDLDMAPFSVIDPCGVPGQPMTQLRDLNVDENFEAIADKVCRGVSERLGYTIYTELQLEKSRPGPADHVVTRVEHSDQVAGGETTASNPEHGEFAPTARQHAVGEAEARMHEESLVQVPDASTGRFSRLTTAAFATLSNNRSPEDADRLVAAIIESGELAHAPNSENVTQPTPDEDSRRRQSSDAGGSSASTLKHQRDSNELSRNTDTMLSKGEQETLGFLKPSNLHKLIIEDDDDGHRK